MMMAFLHSSAIQEMMLLPLAPIPLTNEVVTNYAKDTNFKAWSLFTLPNGMVSLGRYNQTNSYLPSA